MPVAAGADSLHDFGRHQAAAESLVASTTTKSLPGSAHLVEGSALRKHGSNVEGSGQTAPVIAHQRSRQTIHTASRTIRFDILLLPFGPVDEDDRDLRDPEPLLPRPEAHLDLKRIAVRAYMRLDRWLQYLLTKALEATRRVPQLEARYAPSVDVRAVAEESREMGQFTTVTLPFRYLDPVRGLRPRSAARNSGR